MQGLRCYFPPDLVLWVRVSASLTHQP